MNISKIFSNILFLLWVVLLGYRINLVGSISITELLVITQIPRLWKLCEKLKFKELLDVRLLFILLILAQAISEFLLGNTFINAIKGIMVTIMAFFLMCFFTEKLIKTPSLIIWIPLGRVISLLIFGDQFGYAEQGDITFFKFYVAPIVCNFACFLTVFSKWKWIKANVVLFLTCVSLFVIVGGARSLGFTLLFTALVVQIVNLQKRISLRKFLLWCIPFLLVFQIFYAFVYVPKVKSGEWGSEQNRAQLAQIDYSKNSLMMIVAARSDFFVTTQAFLDAPILGHGNLAEDTTLKYTYMALRIAGDDGMPNCDNGYPQIPTHSILMGYGSRYGIAALIIFTIIFLKMIAFAFKTFSPKSVFLPILVYSMIFSIQAILFSPPAILKNSAALYWALIMALFYLKKYNRNKNDKNEIACSNCNL